MPTIKIVTITILLITGEYEIVTAIVLSMAPVWIPAIGGWLLITFIKVLRKK